ncbi:hypothetical protein [Salibacterium halotolerans]|uniref:DUF2281 domain-containing protein n=1 Tax=Salibacterium halotolerans TaxID=1884432 RepID=A0A1I5XHM5_9BACI|nr:hypothetical protein [Salibacterium halotolerans]SFQ31478.1 hypothetical protein SAMN05518683_12812 [Salibacterium halotolerans]
MSLRDDIHALIDSLPEESLVEVYNTLWEYREEEEKEIHEEAKKEVQADRSRD